MALVRSGTVPQYGDHYIVITGAPVLKPHGLRPQDVAIQAPDVKLLDEYRPLQMGLILLKFEEPAASDFLEFHGIEVKNGRVTLPET